MQKGLVLKNDIDFEYAIHFKCDIVVVQHGDVIHVGPIKSHNKVAVTFGDGMFLKAVSEFRVH